MSANPVAEPATDAAADLPMARWPARLELTAALDGQATRLRARHHGPLRLLKTLYPEGPGIAHAVLVHPPGGLVGGDLLDIALDVRPGAHLLVTTPAATRFYRSIAGEAVQTVVAQVGEGARLEWLPQETLAYEGCEGRNELRLHLSRGAAVIAGEVLALGLPGAGQAFRTGRLLQHLELPGLWLDRGRLDGRDAALMEGPCGLAGHRVLGSLICAGTEPFADLESLLADSRALLEGLCAAGITHLARPNGALLLARWVGDDIECVSEALRGLRALWRSRIWALPAPALRIWRT